jgi:hypothetical protein
VCFANLNRYHEQTEPYPGKDVAHNSDRIATFPQAQLVRYIKFGSQTVPQLGALGQKPLNWPHPRPRSGSVVTPDRESAKQYSKSLVMDLLSYESNFPLKLEAIVPTIRTKTDDDNVVNCNVCTKIWTKCETRL